MPRAVNASPNSATAASLESSTNSSRTGVLLLLQIRQKAGFRVVVMTAALVDFLARPRVVDRMPFGDDVEVGWNIEQAMQQQGTRLAGQFFQCEHADMEIIQAQMAAMRFQLRVAHLPVEIAWPAQFTVCNF